MYKVFVNDCPIILTDNKNISINFEVVDFNNADIFEIMGQLLESNSKGIQLLCSDLEVCWLKFNSLFKVQKAAGGKVLNKQHKVLFIYRLDKWDLPKGKLEKGESIEECAIREVEEECGISNLTIENQLETTYHIFERKGETILKITYWYLMHSNFDGELTPQAEEGIKLVEFKNEKNTQKALENTYETIKLLF